MSPAGPLSVTLRFAESTASTEAVIFATRSATPLPGAVAVIEAPAAAGSSGSASSADGARLAAARISVQTLLRIRISMSGDGVVVFEEVLAARGVRHRNPRLSRGSLRRE